MMNFSEAVTIRNSNKYKPFNFDTRASIEEYLKENGYKEISSDLSMSQIVDVSKRLGCPVYSVGKYNRDFYTHWIKFYNPSLFDRVFFCRDEEARRKLEGDKRSCVTGFGTIGYDGWETIDDIEEFIELIEEKLGM